MAKNPKAPTNAPAQGVAVTGNGPQAKTAPTFNQSPQLAPKPPDNGSTNVVDNQRMPGPAGPAAANAVYSGNAQSTGKAQ